VCERERVYPKTEATPVHSSGAFGEVCWEILRMGGTHFRRLDHIDQYEWRIKLSTKSCSCSPFIFRPPQLTFSTPSLARRSAMLGVTCVLVSSAPVSGLVLLPSANQLSVSARSYVCPSAVINRPRIISIVKGQWKESIQFGARLRSARTLISRLFPATHLEGHHHHLFR
jgi:hypothetical protein